MSDQQLNTEKQVQSVQSPFVTFVNGLERLTVGLNNILHKISSVLLMALMFLTAADVIGRFFFNKPITGTYELTGLLLAVMIFFSLGAGQLQRNHIEIDFLQNGCPKETNKRYAVFRLLFYLCCYVL